MISFNGSDVRHLSHHLRGISDRHETFMKESFIYLQFIDMYVET